MGQARRPKFAIHERGGSATDFSDWTPLVVVLLGVDWVYCLFQGCGIAWYSILIGWTCLSLFSARCYWCASGCPVGYF